MKHLRLISPLLLAVSLYSCDKAPQELDVAKTDPQQLDIDKKKVVQHNADMAFAVYSDSLTLAQELLVKVEQLIATPNDANFAAAKQAWLDSRESYGQSEVYRFRNGPIDTLRADGSFGVEGEGPEGRINAWPLGEAIIDYIAPTVDGDAGPENPSSALQGSIIQNIQAYPEINKALLLEYFEYGEDERNVTTGYHAIEFLLWGQDLNQQQNDFQRDNTPGQRPLSDFLTVDQQGNTLCTSGPVSSEAQICQRRSDYLLAATQLLVDDLASLVSVWDPKSGQHYKSVISDSSSSLAKILESMGRLSFGELAGERINIALSTDSQEDEHSCFSDNTHRDIYLNALGIQNSYLGQYTKMDGTTVKGPSIHDLLINLGHNALADELASNLATTMKAAQVIDDKAKNGQPFDVLIQQGVMQPDIRATIEALVAQTDTIERVIQILQLNTGELRQDTEQNLGV